MPLIKKILFTLFVLLSIGLGIWAYLNLKNIKKPTVESLSLMPDSCVLYLRTSDLFELNKKLNSQSLIIDRLKMYRDVAGVLNQLNQFDSISKNNPLLLREITDNDLHFAFYGNDLAWLAAVNIKQLGDQEKVKDELNKLYHIQLDENGISDLEINKKDKLYFSIHSGVMLLASHQDLIKNAIDPSLKKLYQNPSFVAFKNTLSEKALLSVYVNQNLYQKNPTITKLNLPDICRMGIHIGTADIQPSELKVNGYMQPDSLGMLQVLSSQEPQRPDFIGALPFACSYFQAYGFSAFKKVQSKLDVLYPNNQNGFWQAVNDSALYNLKDEFFGNVGDYAVDFKNAASSQKFVLVKVNDTALAKAHLGLMSDSLLRGNSQLIYKLTQIKSKQLLQLLYPLSDCNTRYAAIHDSHIYFSEREDDLAQMFFGLKNHLSLNEQTSFKNYKSQNFPETFNYLTYSIPALDKEDRASFFNFSTDAKNDPFETFRHFSFSLSNHNKQMEFRWHLLNETETVDKEQNMLWAIQLDTLSNMKAHHFVNHINKENELLIQDESLKLYLINAKGTILWKKQLTEKIISDIFVVDMFKNNKYQMLFSSKNQLHLIDRNGNYLKEYPVRLPAEASSPLSIFDYDETRDYRLFIACRNKQIYNYSILGKKQQGFTTFHVENTVRLPIQYVKVGLSDYLVALDEEGKIYTFSRRGEGRIGLKNKAISNCNAFYVDATRNVNTTKFIYTDDKNSLINKISFADKKEIIKLNSDVQNAGVNYSMSADKKTVHVIFSKPNALIVYDLTGNLMLNKVLENDLTEADYFEGQNVYFTHSAMPEELLMMDANGQLKKIFKATALPLVSELFNDGNKYILITHGKRLSCVLFN